MKKSIIDNLMAIISLAREYAKAFPNGNLHEYECGERIGIGLLFPLTDNLNLDASLWANEDDGTVDVYFQIENDNLEKTAFLADRPFSVSGNPEADWEAILTEIDTVRHAVKNTLMYAKEGL